MMAPMLASIGGDAVNWLIFLVVTSAVLAFWYFLLSKFGSF
jgi:hypothetical protein